jgi:hypothetical protein
MLIHTAWVTYNQVKTDDSKLPSHEVRLLEKVNSAWELVEISLHHYEGK